MNIGDLIPLPSRFDHWNPALRGAYLKGVAAFAEGKAQDDCPYEDKRKPSGRLSWSRAFIGAWRDGYQDASQWTASVDDTQAVILYLLNALPAANRQEMIGWITQLTVDYSGNGNRLIPGESR